MADDPLTWERTDRQVAYACPGFDVVKDAVRLPDGTETDFDFLSKPPTVCIIPVTRSGDLVIIEEWRQAVSRVSRGFPAGSVESDDQSFEAAARRELAEETGYEAETVSPLLTVDQANGFSDVRLHVFVADGCRETGNQRLDEDETIRVTTTSLASFTDALRTGEVCDGRTVLALSYYRLFGEEHVE